ncbi:MAG: LytTR family DNA-binding domain-containing protein [Bacteroidota bacterium]
MIKAIIIEDEDLSAKRLVRLLGELRTDVQLVQRLESVDDTVHYLRNHQHEIDLIFLDIHLSDGHSFEVFNQVDIDLPIIFTTAYDKYALQAFRQTSIDYLMKPLQAEDVSRALEKFDRLFHKRTEEEIPDYLTLLQALKPAKTDLKKRFLVQVGAKMRSVAIEEVHLFYAENKACFLITNEGRRYDINYTLEKLMQQLDETQFFRLNRKVIAHIQSIQEVYQFSKSRFRVTLTHSPGFDIFISLERMGAFKKWMNQ